MSANDLKVAKILCRSPRVDSYVDAIAAVVERFPDISEARLVFPTGGRIAGFVDDVQRQLVALSASDLYARGARLRLTDVEEAVDSPGLCTGCAVVDVTAVPKQEAIEIAALAIEGNQVMVGHLNWLETRRGDEVFRVATHEHEYVDLLSGRAAAALRRNYVARKHVLVALGSLFVCVLGLAVAKIVWPAVMIPDDVINLFSLLIGSAGLYLAAISLRAR